MPFVRAKETVFLGEHGYHLKGAEFDYHGPENENLEEIEKGPYHDYSLEELRGELRNRNVIFPLTADHKALEGLLAQDDKEPAKTVVKAKPVKKKTDKAETGQDGSGSEKYGASDWTAAGMDKDGFPVEKGSADDVS